MTGITSKVVEKAWRLTRHIRREYMLFTSNMECLRIVVNPKTLLEMEQEFWEEMRQRGANVHEGFYVQSVEITRDATNVDNRMLGVRVMTDESVPEYEVELRSVLARSWEAV